MKIGLILTLTAIFAMSGCGFDIEQSVKSLPSELPPVLGAFADPSSDIYTASTTVLLSWTLVRGTSVTYKVEKFQSSNCSGTAVSSVTRTSTNYSLTGLIHGNTYSVRIEATDANGTSSPQCSPNIIIDTVAPIVTFINPSVATNLGADSYAFSWSGVDSGPSGLEPNDTYAVEKFDNGSCAGAPVTTFTQIVASHNYSSFISGTSYSLRITAIDRAGNLSAPLCSSAVTYVIGTPSISLSDPMTMSGSFARQIGVNISIGNDAAAAKWCVSETQTAAPADGNAACNGSKNGGTSWYNTRPTTINLSAGDATKTVYIWVANNSDTVIGASVN